MDIKDTARDVKTGTKEAVREGDGHTFTDDLGNAGDRMKDDLGKAGDKIREGADDLERNAHSEANQPR
ncbi:MAG: hypothetical protein ACHQXL_04730 [Candidatus Limnocylindrales bacterium]|jgi:hypothetical protein